MKPDNFEDAYSRIRNATKTRTQTEVAAILGIKQSSISDAKKKNTVPDGWLIKLYREFGLEPDWILYGSEPQLRHEGAPSPLGVCEPRGRYTASASRAVVLAMTRTDPETGAWVRDPLETIPLPESLSRPSLIVIKMDNTSMEPTIRRHAYIGLDTGDTVIRSGEIYALDVPGEGLAVKRLVRDLEKKRLIIHADNPVHQEQFLPLDNPGIQTVGKAVWVIQEI